MFLYTMRHMLNRGNQQHQALKRPLVCFSLHLEAKAKLPIILIVLSCLSLSTISVCHLLRFMRFTWRWHLTLRTNIQQLEGQVGLSLGRTPYDISCPWFACQTVTRTVTYHALILPLVSHRSTGEYLGWVRIDILC